MAVLKKVSGVRQIEIAELMVSVNNFSSSYAHALLIGTAPDHLLHPSKPKVAKGLSAGEILRLESEMESLERDFKAAEAAYGENMLNLTSLGRYVKKLLANSKVAKFLSTHYADLFEELEAVAKIKSLSQAEDATLPLSERVTETENLIGSSIPLSGKSLPPCSFSASPVLTRAAVRSCMVRRNPCEFLQCWYACITVPGEGQDGA